MYAREYNGGLMVGWFEKKAKPAFEKGTVPKDWEKHVKQDMDHFRKIILIRDIQKCIKIHLGPLWESAVLRFPILEHCYDPELVNSPDNFTPDGRWILGEAPEVKNYFVACGMNGNSLQVD